ncbi:glycosyltransferase family 2 protein [Acinetobacter gerneri]|uniref:glycosyltransferase family 2 protein n=1 Tax=Acinetobacter gerneri TaxID=202952 RepID=UPI0028B109EB|nr:glycosyltransferase family 2 protein [Acinetobacter gerneri]
MDIEINELQEEFLISIIIPVYNGNDTIINCLKSIQNQSYRNIEVIVVDDGSIDNTYSLCHNFALKDSRFKLFTKNNKGVSSARNLGLNKATGSFITFIDGDDVVHVKYIEYMLSTALKNNVDICISNFCRINIKNTLNDQITRQNVNELINIEIKILNSSQTIESMIMNDYFKWEVCGKLFKSHIVKNKYFNEDEILFEDFSYTCKTLLVAHKIAFIPLEMYYYVDNPTSASKQKYNDKLTHLVTTAKNFEVYVEKNYPELVHCSIYFNSIIYFDILDKIIMSSNSFKDCFVSFKKNKNNGKKYFLMLVSLRNLVLMNKFIPKKIKLKYIFTFNYTLYYFVRFSVYKYKRMFN